jgi:hypothetical protein
MIEPDVIDLVEGVADEIVSLVKKKNQDYGNSFEELIKKYGDVALLIRFHDKFNRLESLLLKGAEPQVTTEPVKDTFKDIVGYGLLAVALIAKNEMIKAQLDGKQ